MRVSFDEVFEAEVEPVHAYLYRRLGSSIADDLTAEVFATAYRRWEDFDQSRPVRPWLYGIAANLVRHYWRKERRMLRAYARSGLDRVVDQGETTVERLDAESRKRALAAALANLRAEERDILLLHAWAELSDSEIAETLSLPLGTVKSRLHRARQRMGNQLGGNGQTEVRATTIPMREEGSR